MSVHWAGGRFHGWVLMNFHQTHGTIPGARMHWLHKEGDVRGVFPSRKEISGGALSDCSNLMAPWTMGCYCLLDQVSWADQNIKSCCMAPQAWKLHVWVHVGSRWSGLPELCSLFKLTFLLLLAIVDVMRLSVSWLREHPSCKMQFQCFHSDVF